MREKWVNVTKHCEAGEMMKNQGHALIKVMHNGRPVGLMGMGDHPLEIGSDVKDYKLEIGPYTAQGTGWFNVMHREYELEWFDITGDCTFEPRKDGRDTGESASNYVLVIKHGDHIIGLGFHDKAEVFESGYKITGGRGWFSIYKEEGD